MACNGISPTSPNATVASDDATAVVETQALKGSVDGSACRDITAVRLGILPSPSPGYVLVEARYFWRGVVPSGCQTAPDWSSKPLGRLIATGDAFAVKVTRTNRPSAVQVTAKAPNGVEGSIPVR